MTTNYVAQNQYRAYRIYSELATIEWVPEFKKILLELAEHERKDYLFWYSYYQNKASNGNPFSSPTNIHSFITGDDVLGGFFGYSPSFDTLVIRKK